MHDHLSIPHVVFFDGFSGFDSVQLRYGVAGVLLICGLLNNFEVFCVAQSQFDKDRIAEEPQCHEVRTAFFHAWELTRARRTPPYRADFGDPVSSRLTLDGGTLWMTWMSM